VKPKPLLLVVVV